MCVLIVFGHPAILSILIYSKKLINFLFWQIFISGKKRRAATFNKFFASTVDFKRKKCKNFITFEHQDATKIYHGGKI